MYVNVIRTCCGESSKFKNVFCPIEYPQWTANKWCEYTLLVSKPRPRPYFKCTNSSSGTTRFGVFFSLSFICLVLLSGGDSQGLMKALIDVRITFLWKKSNIWELLSCDR